MIALLSYSINLFANDTHPSTGELHQSSDSVMIAYDDLRIVNSKLIELEYEKEINVKLNDIISNDKTIISNYDKLNKKLRLECNKQLRSRNIAIGGCITLTILGTVLLLVK